MTDSTADSVPARDADTEVLGLIGTGELFAFEAMADAASRTSDLQLRISLDRMAPAHIDAYNRIMDRLTSRGADISDLLERQMPALSTYHARTVPTSEMEALLKVYVGFGLTSDFAKEVASFLAEDTREFVSEVLAEPQPGEIIGRRVRAVIAAEPAKAGKLALWGRRLVGEALSQAQRVVADQPDMVALLSGGQDDVLTTVAQMMARITKRHSERMNSLGLAP